MPVREDEWFERRLRALFIHADMFSRTASPADRSSCQKQSLCFGRNLHPIFLWSFDGFYPEHEFRLILISPLRCTARAPWRKCWAFIRKVVSANFLRRIWQSFSEKRGIRPVWGADQSATQHFTTKGAVPLPLACTTRGRIRLHFTQRARQFINGNGAHTHTDVEKKLINPKLRSESSALDCTQSLLGTSTRN